tara:strand:- start:18691 stop:20127 length:1437 start_codon:yes stop_codon:yes gene_type:complete
MHVAVKSLVMVGLSWCIGASIGCGGESEQAAQDAGNGDGGIEVNIDAGVSTGTGPGCSEESQRIRDAAGTIVEVSPAGPGQVTVDGATTTLRAVVAAAEPGDTIVLADGTYTFAESDGANFTGLYFTKDNITLRSASGDASAVILDSDYADHGGSTAPITISAAGITVSDLTVRRSIFHLVHFSGGGSNSIIHNVRLLDGGQQFLKSSSGNGTIDNVRVTCGEFAMTSEGRDNVWGYGATNGGTRCYTGGIDAHEAIDWVVSDNRFEGIYCDATGVQRPAHGKKGDERGGTTYNGGLAEHAIHMWDSASGGHTLVRNHIVNCARGIGVGLVDDVYGAFIANNMIFSEHAGGGEHDVAISVERGHGTRIINNTVFFLSPDAYPNGIEYRFDSSDTEIRNNLTNGLIKSRNGAEAITNANLANAESSWFADPNRGDLHLAGCDLAGVAGAGDAVPGAEMDIDGELRESAVDLGADQCSVE